MRILTVPGRYAVARRPAGSTVPTPSAAADLFVVAVTRDEISIVADERDLAGEPTVEAGWALFRVEGAMDFGLVGVLASLTGPLAAAGIPVFAVSTFDTDYVLVKAERADGATAAWQDAGIDCPPPIS
jgi:hypothetical protein